MKKLFLILIAILGIAIQGYSSPNDETFTYRVLSITQCLLRNGEVFEGETTFPKDNRIVYVDDTEVAVIINKENIKITFDIKDFKFEDGILVYTTTHRLSGDKVTILVKRFNNGIFTFSFINFNDENCYIYKVEYFK